MFAGTEDNDLRLVVGKLIEVFRGDVVKVLRRPFNNYIRRDDRTTGYFIFIDNDLALPVGLDRVVIS